MRDRFFKKKVTRKTENVCKLSDKESVGDVLKKIRDKSSTPKHFYIHKKDP
jgi:hypothetical protein